MINQSNVLNLDVEKSPLFDFLAIPLDEHKSLYLNQRSVLFCDLFEYGGDLYLVLSFVNSLSGRIETDKVYLKVSGCAFDDEALIPSLKGFAMLETIERGELLI